MGQSAEGTSVAEDACLFCRIAAGQLPATVVYADDEVMAFRDIAPRAPIHVLVIPRRHIVSVMDMSDEDEPLLGHMFSVIREVARQDGIAEAGFRVVSNAGPDGGQTVDHLHFHVFGGRFMTWPPG